MIVFTRLNGGAIAINPDMIERVEANPDTVITLADDKKFLVAETLNDVISLVTDYRAYVLARAESMEVVDRARPVLHLVEGIPGRERSAALDPSVLATPRVDDAPVTDDDARIIDYFTARLPDGSHQPDGDARAADLETD
ncbi:MAG: flagellar FlbD family protein [Acidimicrobiales bacterium]